MTERVDLPRIIAGERPVLSIRNQLIFPGCEEEIQVVRPRSRALLATLAAADSPIITVFLQRDVGTERPEHADLQTIGVAVRVHQIEQHRELGFIMRVEGLQRVQRAAVVSDEPFLVATVAPFGDANNTLDHIDDDRHGVPDLETLRTLASEAVPDFIDRRDLINQTGHRDHLAAEQLVDRIAAKIPATLEERAAILEAASLADRVALALALVRQQLSWQTTMEHLDLPTIETMKQVWPLKKNGEARIDRELNYNGITAAEAEQLRCFRDRGYVVWKGLIDDAEIDQLLAEIQGIRQQPGRYLLTDHRRARPFRFSESDFDHFENIHDTHVNLEIARRICFHPTIQRFLELIFEVRPIATQQLLFQRSNIHPMHQDTSFVCMREPLLMVASWIALEDVVPGRGELTYYEGSHRIAHFAYADGSKRSNPLLDDGDEAREEILRRCHTLGCQKRDFIAGKGDVLIWAADLVHGSNPRTRPEEETRRSLVTHYCPESTEPLYFLRDAQHRGRQPFGERAFLSSSHYKAPTGECPATPTFPLPEPC
ncbi:MAG: phytanoyl-CoA hydroxylase [Pseudohongiellaceae bacterium]|jgi:phytanoyl-CoA hydroxylase